MCTKEEVREVVKAEIAPLKTLFQCMEMAIGEVKSSLINLPCNALSEKIIRMDVNLEATRREVGKLESDRDQLFELHRENSKNIATLIEHNEGQDAFSAKTWTLILLGINFVYGIALYFLTRSPV